MKPQKLTMCAFGPYLKKTVIDFSILGESGIYLVTGDTGAGKTTIFEALSFALYGCTSGSERTAEMLRNKLADDNTKSYVELEFTEKNKRYSIYRAVLPSGKAKKSAKKSGDENYSKANFVCLDDGKVIASDSEANSAIVSVVGIDRKRFKQISMIAQGEFMKVLNEKTGDRMEILRDIFRTEKYGKLQSRLAEMTEEADSAQKSVELAVLADIKRISCGDKSEFSEKLSELLKANSDMIVNDKDIQALTEKIISEDKQRAEFLQEQIRNLSEKIGELDRKIGAAKQKQQQITVLEKSFQSAESNVSGLYSELEKLGKLKEQTAENPKIVEELSEKIHIQNAKLKDYDEYEQKIYALIGLSEKLKSAKFNLDCAQKAKSESEESLSLTEKRLSELADLDVVLERKKAELQKLQIQRKSLREFYTDIKACHKAFQSAEIEEKNYLESKMRFENADRDYSIKNTAFLDGQAGILALSLSDGKACPVCGSLEHPKPASLLSDVPTKEEVENSKALRRQYESEWQKASETAGIKRGEAQKSKEKLKADSKEIFGEVIEISLMPERVTNDGKLCKMKIDSLNAEISQIQNEKDEKLTLQKEKSKISERILSLSKTVTDSTAEIVASSAMSEKLNAETEKLRSELEFESKSKALNEINIITEKKLSLEEEYLSAKDNYDKCQISLGRETSRLDEIKKQLQELASENQDSAETVSEMESVRLDLNADLSSLNDEFNSIKIRLSANQISLDSIRKNSAKLAVCRKNYNNILQLSSTANGKVRGKDKIGFETYVQSLFFDSILNKANVRLLQMSGSRYCFVRSEEAQDKRSKSGLDLDVIDNESGERRTVKSLSGGESFIAALSLALGFSDEIQSAAGGIKLEAMFIDEGFGSLDRKSLENSILALNSISTGNCLIGIISHVSELKEMINKRIVVTSGKNGTSNISVET